jgi:hypothetical protein
MYSNFVVTEDARGKLTWNEFIPPWMYKLIGLEQSCSCLVGRKPVGRRSIFRLFACLVTCMLLVGVKC